MEHILIKNVLSNKERKKLIEDSQRFLIDGDQMAKMLNKSIIDANKSIQKFALLFGVDFEALKCGEKRVMEAEFVEGDPCKVTFYKAKTRGDRRVSITKLKANAEAGDLIALGYRGNKAVIFVYNVTQQQVREA